MGEQRIAVRFTGGAFASLGYTLLCGVLSVFILPVAWAAVLFIGWWCRNLSFSDGSRAEFIGKASRIWPLFAVMVFLAFLPSIVTVGMEQSSRTSYVQLLLMVALIPFSVAVTLPVYRWIFENISFEPGGTLRFSGRYLPYLGWVLLFNLASLTLVGWPWVATAIARWFCRNIEGDGWSVSFVGTGWGLLWRSLVWFVCSMLLIPVPWVLRSIYRWWTENIVIVRNTTSDAFSLA